MVRGGNKTGGSNSNNRGNHFANLEVEDRSQLEDPFHLNNGDHPSMSLVSSLLTGNNFNSWSQAMRMALIAKNKFSFVDGTISKPDIDDLSCRTWSRCNNMNNGPRIFQIKQQLSSLSQGSLDVSGYFTKLKALWDELKDFRPVSTRTCGGLKDLMCFRDQDYVLQFLMGLNDSYNHVRAQILMIDPLPSMNRVLSLVIQEEQQRGLSSSNHFPFVSSSNSTAFGVATSNYNSYKGKRDKPLCTHYGFLGHTIDKCYKIHGYPPGFKMKFSYQNRGQMKQYGVQKVWRRLCPIPLLSP
ncbi:hypothetical protein UlMin_012998 [Ulmus minor]